jgi:acyl carrier protein
MPPTDEEVRKLVAERFGIDKSEVARFLSDAKMDSLDRVEVAMLLEEAFEEG